MNLQDYVRWRGDLTFAERPFTIVDNLALAAVSYLNLAGIVPGATRRESITVREAARLLTARRGGVLEEGLAAEDLAYEERRLPIVDSSLLEDMARSARFGPARLSRFIDVVDGSTGIQFAAVTIDLDDGTRYVSFRGTDETILGWREDFTMSFETIPAQLAAARYLTERTSETTAGIRVGGHSKGGHLTQYAAMVVADEIQDRLIGVYSNDGPGVAPEVADPARLERLGSRFVKVIPEFAVVGLLFESAEDARIVRSDAPGILQHYITSWQVERDDLVELDSIEPRAQVIKTALDEWLEAVGPNERRTFTEDFFDALTAGGATLITEVGDQDFGGFESVLVTFGRHRGDTRHAVSLAVRSIARATATINYRNLLRRADAVRAVLIALLGGFFVIEPELAAQVVSSLGLVLLFVLLGVSSAVMLLRRRDRRPPGWRRVVLLAVLLALAFVTVLQLQALVAPSNVLFGLLLIGNAWFNARRALMALRERRRRRFRAALRTLSAIISLVLAVVVLSNAREVVPLVVQHTGQYLLVAGLVEAFLVLRDQVGRRYASTAAVVRLGIEQGSLPWGAQPLRDSGGATAATGSGTPPERT